MKKSRKSITTPGSPREHILRLVDWMATGVYEKEQIIAVALLSAVAGENLFILGPPGTAKSMVAARLKGVFRDARSFDYLMSRFSTPDEIFGPVSIRRLKEMDRYERLTEGYLPDADVVFLDEIWKAGPSIQNTLLTVINEHLFYNGGRAVTVPMKVLIAASNELPAADEGLEALYDRFLMRMVSNCISGDSAFFRMLESPAEKPEPLPDELLIDNELYNSWQTLSRGVTLGDEVRASIRALRRSFARLEKQDSGKMRFYISDRRWRKAYRLMQTSAFLNGRAVIDLSDFFLLIHAFWNDVETIPTVIEAFTGSLTESLSLTLSMLERNIRLSMKPSSPQPKAEPAPASPQSAEPEFAEFDYFYYMTQGLPGGDIYFSKWDYSGLSDTPREGVRYFDTRRKRWMIHALMPGTTFDAEALNASQVSRVRLRKCSGGIIIDSAVCPFVRKNAAAAPVASARELAEMPVVQRIEAMKSTLASAVAQWEEKMEQTWRREPNIFLSKADKDLIDKAITEARQLIKTTEVKLKNLDLML